MANKFPDAIILEVRSGFFGAVVKSQSLLDVAKTLRDAYSFDYLSAVTGVDDFPEDRMEVIYHFFKSIGGPQFELKVFTTRNEPTVPSLTGLYPGAELQEREIWDLFGIKFTNHPDLRRILMWDDFEGHPLRKDWKEPFYEEDVKPFKNRWPEGKARHSENTNPFQDNVQYPREFNPANWTGEADHLMYKSLIMSGEQSSNIIKTDQLVVNLGPQHPSTHGVFRMVVVLEGETIVNLRPVVGYMHRNHEKIGERNTFLQNMPYTDRLDYLSSMSNNFGYSITIEKMLGITPPERAEYIRVMMAELTRIASHVMSIGFLMNDLGAYFTPALYALEERELILDIFEAVAGSRMMCNYFRFGGVVRDVPEDVMKKVKHLVENRLPRKIDELDRYLTKNEIVRTRCEGVGVITSDEAIAFSATGPILRATGVPYDIRRADPYSIYESLDFDVCIRNHGDVYDRYLLRMDEIRQSLRILRQVLNRIPKGPVISGKPQYLAKVPAGESYGRVEGPRGELGFYIVSDGKPNPKRYHVRAPSFINLTGLAQMCKGAKVADAVTILGSVDIVLGEVDR
ncbi:MAG: NADH-quinone oxidoreductase subunit NuoD [Anaerolinea sp.]|nr:NADH-quinone oxidoreductase subunit NuoD [Anaerolinea sp.]